MSEPRLLMFHDPVEASRWQRALDGAGLDAQCLVFDEPFLDDRGFWQPPRWHWYDLERDGRTKHVFIIDGFWFRNNIRIDFSEGGNHMAYEAIPPDCEYIELGNDEDTIDERIVVDHHETPEDIRMEDDPACVYEEAHGFATAEERGERDKYRDPRVHPEAEPAVQSSVDPIAIAHSTLSLKEARS